MKRRTAIIIAALALAIVLAGLAAAVLNRFYVPPRPGDTDLELWILDDAERIDWSGHAEVTGWFGAREYLGAGYTLTPGGGKPEKHVSYILTAWPDLSSGGSFVTTIEITDPAVAVYGLTLSSTPEDFRKAMESRGFEVYRSADPASPTLTAHRSRIFFYFTPSQSLKISARVTNNLGIEF